MAELNIATAIERISSSGQKERTEGLADLKHILQHNRRSSKKGLISDKSYHALYEALFRFTSTERSQYAKTTKSTARSAIANRLDGCAETLRLAVEMSVRAIRTKTVRAVLEHIINMLPMPGGGYCQPLIRHYLKCMRTILEFQPHVEHLSKAVWKSVAEFCIEGVTLLEDADSNNSLNSNGHSYSRTTDASAERSSWSTTREPQTREPRADNSATNAQELVICLRLLTLAPNAPVTDVAETALSTLIAYLQSSKRVGRAHPDALAAMNSILSAVVFENTKVAQSAIRQLLPIIKDLWLSRTAPAFKDQLLAVLLLSQENVAHMLGSQDDGLLLDVEALVDTLRSEYGKRQDRDQLQIDEVYLQHREDCVFQTPFQNQSFSLRPNSLRSEGCWTVLFLMAYFSELIFAKYSPQVDNKDTATSDDSGRPRKRSRPLDPMSEYLMDLYNSQISVRISALQVVAFMADRIALSSESIGNVVDKLMLCVSDKNPRICSWALVCISAIASQEASGNTELNVLWTNIWQIAARNVTSPSTCRAACHVMNILLKLKLVKYTLAMETIDIMLLSTNLNGPAVLAESSASLFTTVIQETAKENPSSMAQLSERISNWFFSRWTPSSFAERVHPAQNAYLTDSSDVLRLLSACIDRPLPRSCAPFIALGTVGQAAMRSHGLRSLACYILLLKEEERPHKVSDLPFSNGATGNQPTNSRFSAESIIPVEGKILDACTSEIQLTVSTLDDWISERPQNISQFMLQAISSLCIVSSSMSHVLQRSNVKRAETLRKSVDVLLKSMMKVICRQEASQAQVDGVLQALSSVLPDVKDLHLQDDDIFDRSGLVPMALQLSQSLDERKSSAKQLQSGFDDFMDIDVEFGSQQGHDSVSQQTIDFPRSVLSADYDLSTYRNCINAYVHFILSLSEEATDVGRAEIVPRSFVEYLTSLSDAESVLSRPFVNSLFSSSFQIQAEAVDELLGYLGESMIGSYDNSHCEITICFCAEVMTGCSGLWTSNVHESAYNAGTDLYEWFVGIALEQGFSSCAVQTRASDLFFSILKSRPDYANSLSKVPSVRTSLFQLLQDGDIIVKYHIGQRLFSIFENFILSKHDEVFGDIFDSLPKEGDWPEGIALRLLILSRLGAAWHTLLRRCVYHIYETAGLLQFSIEHATICVQELCSALRFDSPQSLFTIFAPQLLYTWLENQDLDTIPHSIFKYNSLVELLEDAQDEVFGQAVMRGQTNHIQALGSFLNDSSSELLRRNFSKAAAYSISWDISLHKKGDESSEATIRGLLGKDQTDSLMRTHFPRIIGLMFLSMDQLKAVQKGFSPGMRASSILEEMSSYSVSSNPLPADQQPSFNARFLTSQITRLANRVGYKPDGLWTPAIVVFVMRMLLSRIIPALGSLHACSIIRKVRVLLSIAGDVVLSGYPLQMALHALRPFLTDSQCADDTLGIVQYLFHNGRSSLVAQFSFMTGIGLSTLMSLRVFLSSSQESTTQESQHRATMSKAQRFHSWFARYLEDYLEDANKAITLPRQHYEAFKSIMADAAGIRTEGNSSRDTPESRLLLALLDDDRSERKLLSEPAENLAFSLLCHSFLPPTSYTEDILGSDHEATGFAAQVFKACRKSGVGDGYLVWAARVLGRAFAATGEVQESLRKSMRQVTLPGSDTNAQVSQHVRSSRTAILETLSDLLFSDKMADAGLAEDTLRLILSRSAALGNALEVEANLPQATIPALSLSMTEQLENRQPVPSFSIKACAFPVTNVVASEWIRDFTISLAQSGSQDAVLGCLPRVLQSVQNLGEKLFPFLLHLTISRSFDENHGIRESISEAFNRWFKQCRKETTPHVRILLKALVYLRTQEVPREHTCADRDQWLQLDYLKAAEASVHCGLHRLALLFLETYTSQQARLSRRTSSPAGVKVSTELQLSIYRNLDEPDSYYGVEQEPSLSSILNRLEYEGDGAKGLFFRGARMDSQIRRLNTVSSEDSRGMLQSLTMLNLNSITHSLLSTDKIRDVGEEAVNSFMYTARKLERWDIRASESNVSEANILFKALQGVHKCTDVHSAQKQINAESLSAIKTLLGANGHLAPVESYLRTLAVLTEMHDILSAVDTEQLQETWERFQSRNNWMYTGRLEDFSPILSCREVLFSILSQNHNLQSSLHTPLVDIRRMEASSLLSSSTIYRKRGALQEALASASYLVDIADECNRVGFPVYEPAQYELSDVLWDQGETATSIRMLQHLLASGDPKQPLDNLELCRIFTRLGSHMAEARLENPDEIITKYLAPAIQELRDETNGQQAGEAFHTFSSFCDAQLSNGEIDEDIQRTQNQAQRQYEDSEEFERLSKAAKGQQRDHFKRNARRAKKVADIDMQEYQRLRGNKETFLRQSLENYLLTLQACDTYNNDVLRVFALWLEYSNTPQANEAMSKFLSSVPSGKFAVIMNQLSSRLQAEQSEFQTMLSDLVFRICLEHPYHSLHHIFSGIMSLGVRDEAARSRNAAAKEISQLLRKHERSKRVWNAVHDSDQLYHELAMVTKEELRGMSARELTLDKLPGGRKMIQKIPGLRVPPATLSIEVRPDCDYSNVPVIASFRSRVGIAGGLSAPKIVRVIASDGVEHRQLFKSGSDDMRQDAIMEQVFEHSSKLLKKHTATRVRDLHIRTYNVLPLSARSGMIEFVQNTISLADVLIPMHQKYNPKEYRSDQCRKIIEDAQKSSVENRVKEFRRVMDHFSPVMRYFFIERFQNPDDWFERRLAYTRTTAAISMLGWVLGLGDRHCQNILLDERNGEVVHIDLGVAFEMGRILPVPELVPFRLTRDLVDAMGYTKTEGVFRRCCEFTLDTLRNEHESIMILLNVLRYDPLVSWSISPLKAKRMQEQQDQQQPEGPVREYDEDNLVEQSPKKKDNDEGDAGRALAVVEKKLSKNLSTAATVSGLIHQATDIKNQAMLFCGWAAHC